MSDLGEVIGTLLAGLAQARRIADEETVTLAEHYRRQPLLAGLSVPRVRVPEMTVELPVIVEAQEGPGEPDPDRVGDRVLDAVREWAAAISFTPPPTLLPSIGAALAPMLRSTGGEPTAERRQAAPPSRELRLADIPEAASRSVVDTLGKVSRRRFDEAELSDLQQRVFDAASAAILVTGPPRMSINALTRAVKETADPSTVARLRISLKEEGLEWTTLESDDGTVRRLLTPE